jgi:hemerythrin-like domain-containing protein
MNMRLPTPVVPGFDQPLEMMQTVHLRTEHRCALLERLTQHLSDNGPDERARLTAETILQYFDDPGKKHQADAEESLYPALLATGRKDRPRLVVVVRELTGHHRELDKLWTTLREQLLALSERGENKLDGELVARFCSLMALHIEREAREILPRAFESLSAQQIVDLGRAMAKRRRVSYPQGESVKGE